ncbi:hypothetical protein AGDE_14435 [Angomonas deanei]|nr:hypothetical protein AGDE_14435 [Angomonas deanei]|eukprot:EPY20869.1 hypothetical protein AGDE_14435 [Angomonas deanei]
MGNCCGTTTVVNSKASHETPELPKLGHKRQSASTTPIDTVAAVEHIEMIQDRNLPPAVLARTGEEARYEEHLFSDSLLVSQTTLSVDDLTDMDHNIHTSISVDVSQMTHICYDPALRLSDLDLYTGTDEVTYARGGFAERERKLLALEADRRAKLTKRMMGSAAQMGIRMFKDYVQLQRGSLLQHYFSEKIAIQLQIVEADEFLQRQLLVASCQAEWEGMWREAPTASHTSTHRKSIEDSHRFRSTEGDLTSSYSQEEEETVESKRCVSVSVRGESV